MNSSLHPDDEMMLDVIREFRNGQQWGFVTFHFKRGALSLAETHRTYKPVVVDKPESEIQELRAIKA